MLVEVWSPCEGDVPEALKRRVMNPGRDIVVISFKGCNVALPNPAGI
jgi:hypothetical protein